MATHSSVLAWRILWTEEPGNLQSMGSQKTRLSIACTHTHTHTHTHTRIYINVFYSLIGGIQSRRWWQLGRLKDCAGRWSTLRPGVDFILFRCSVWAWVSGRLRVWCIWRHGALQWTTWLFSAPILLLIWSNGNSAILQIRRVNKSQIHRISPKKNFSLSSGAVFRQHPSCSLLY